MENIIQFRKNAPEEMDETIDGRADLAAEVEEMYHSLEEFMNRHKKEQGLVPDTISEILRIEEEIKYLTEELSHLKK